MTQAVCSQELTLCTWGARRVTVLGLSVTETCDQEKSGMFWKKRMIIWGWCRGLGWWPGRVRCDQSDQCDQVPGCGQWLRWAEQPQWTRRPGQPSRCWPMSGVARVTNLVTWRVTGAAWAAWHPAVAGWASTQSGDTESGAGTRAMTLSMRHSGHRETSDSVISVTSWQSDVTQHYRQQQAHQRALQDTWCFIKFLDSEQHNNKISRHHGASTSDQFWYSKAAEWRFIWSWVSAFRSPSNLLLELSVGHGERKRLFWIRGTSREVLN